MRVALKVSETAYFMLLEDDSLYWSGHPSMNSRNRRHMWDQEIEFCLLQGRAVIVTGK